MERYNILPADTYIVINKSILNNEDRTILNMLYQPIIGPLPIMLYFSLWSDLDKMNIMSDELTHHHLVSNMHLSLDEIVLARKKLEAIGLVKTYYKEGSVNNYVYELYSPLSAHEFLTHPILNIVLYNNIGATEYEYLKKQYQKIKMDIKPLLSLKARITSIKEIEAGDSISYGRTYIASSKQRIATISLGYADGLPRSLSNKDMIVKINNNYRKVLGKICMDQLVIDITDIDDVDVGSVIYIIDSSDSKLSAELLAEKADTITYELLSRLGQRLPRIKK